MDKYWGKLAGQAITVLLTIVISMTGFWMMIGREFTTRNEVLSLIRTQTQSLQGELDRHNKQEEKLEKIIERNTDVIQELRIQMATLSAILERSNAAN